MATEPITMESLGSTHKYFEYRDQPARKLTPESMPEVYKFNNGWVPVDSSWDFMHNYLPCDEARIKEMIAKIVE